MGFGKVRFLGQKTGDGLIDLPFALPTAVAGISLTLYIPRMVGLEGFSRRLESKYHILPGYSCCLGFIGFPFVVRTVQPVLESFGC